MWERNINQLPLTHTPTRTRTCNPGTLCPDQESNRRHFALWANAQPTEPLQSGLARDVSTQIISRSGHVGTRSTSQSGCHLCSCCENYALPTGSPVSLRLSGSRTYWLIFRSLPPRWQSTSLLVMLIHGSQTLEMWASWPWRGLRWSSDITRPPIQGSCPSLEKWRAQMT